MLIPLAAWAESVVSGLPKPKLERLDNALKTICTIVVCFCANKMEYLIDNILVIRDNLSREFLFSWEHPLLPPFCVLPGTQKGCQMLSFFKEQVTAVEALKRENEQALRRKT